MTTDSFGFPIDDGSQNSSSLDSGLPSDLTEGQTVGQQIVPDTSSSTEGFFSQALQKSESVAGTFFTDVELGAEKVVSVVKPVASHALSKTGEVLGNAVDTLEHPIESVTSGLIFPFVVIGVVAILLVYAAGKSGAIRLTSLH